MKRSIVVVGATVALLVAGVVVLPHFAEAKARPSIQQLKVKVLEKRPHDTTAFTEGFVISHGVLYETTGLEGESSIRATNPMTGAVLKRTNLPPQMFGEGVAVVGNKIWQLTWADETALLWDRATLTKVGQASYTGEGWGLCFDGHRLVMSNGTDLLTFRDPKTFAQIGQVRVRAEGVPVFNINELECTRQGVFANIWLSDRIVRIDPSSGRVTAVVDASGLHQATDPDDVLNGIAAIPNTNDFLITGKRWPTTYRVRFTPTGR